MYQRNNLSGLSHLIFLSNLPLSLFSLINFCIIPLIINTPIFHAQEIR